MKLTSKDVNWVNTMRVRALLINDLSQLPRYGYICGSYYWNMSLPLDTIALITGKSVESERLEYKESWNPEDVLHTMCAFANDMHNWGGGYIVIGVAENDGLPVLPPKGVNPSEIDTIQRKLVELGHQVIPNYHPISDVCVYEGKSVLIIWCPAGDDRPYSAPVSLNSKKDGKRVEYIRIQSETKQASHDQRVKLFELAQRIPFDDRMNREASIDDLDLGLIREYLKEVKSDLYLSSSKMSMEDLASSMLLVRKYGEQYIPLNVGLLFFSEHPERFFSRARIEVVYHFSIDVKGFDEKIFDGPLHYQLRGALAYINNLVIRERVEKLPDVAEANRFFNYPFAAIEEALANAVYHKSYEKNEPIEVQIWPDKIEILSYPGPIPPVTKKSLLELPQRQRIIAREYRNRRVGDFLKELSLTEGRGTGIQTIYAKSKANGSPMPVFETDDDLNYFLVTLFCRKDMIGLENKGDSLENKGDSLENKSGSLEDKGDSLENKGDSLENKLPEEILTLVTNLGRRSSRRQLLFAVLKLCSVEAMTIERIALLTKRSEQHIRQNNIRILLKDGLLEPIYESPTNPSQAYRATEKGRIMIANYEMGVDQVVL